MKTKALIIIVAFFTSISFMAATPRVEKSKTLTDYGSIEEIVQYGKKYNIPEKKSIVTYNLAGTLQERVIYQWNRYENNWTPIHKRGYSQNTKKLVVTFTEWDVVRKNWSNNTEIFTYDLKDNGILSMVENKSLDKYNSDSVK